MSLNKFMHPRNRYKASRPDFEALGQKYPEFKMHLVDNAKGKPVLDFQNPEALRVLTICMLKEDYGLTIELPPDRLVPTLPLRLNYVHWIEDIIKDWNKKELNAIDIGTGACCVYPILSLSTNPWRFLATETDDVNFSYAIKNLQENKLTDKIKVVKVTPNTILEGVIGQTEETYDFCMCNPPFFADHFEAQGLVSRSPSRPDAKTMSTASPQESIVEGGEVAFVRKMIEESNFLQERVRVYTTMLGKKASLAPLKEIFRRHKITNSASTEFCQGKTMRWGLAWSFDKSVTFPIHFREGKQTKFFALLTITAAENTWIHSRRKRRQMMRETTSKSADVTSETATTASETSTSATSQCDASSEVASNSAVSELCDSAKEIDDGSGSVSVSVAEVDGDRKEGQHSQLTAAPSSAQAVTEAKAEHKKRKSERETDKSSESPPAKLAKVESESSLSTDVEMSNGPSATSQASSEESQVSSVQNPPSTDVEASNGTVSASQTSSEGCQHASVSEETNSSTAAAPATGGEAEDVKGKDRPPAQFVLKCHMGVRVQESDLAVELTWLAGEDIQLMHQLMQFFKNRLAQRKPS